MSQEKTKSSKDKISLIKAIYSKAIIDITRIKKERGEKINNLMAKIDKKSADEILKDIKNLK